MAKRTSFVEEADSTRGSVPSSKRARTTDSDDDDEPQIEMTHRAKRQANGNSVNGRRKSKASRRSEGDDDDDDEEESAEEDVFDEDQLVEQDEDEHRARILADLEKRNKIAGGIAEYGIIERIELWNFMCHRSLAFDFGPQINFVIGHNGSGKSAVLSGITVALGGKSTSTGRGSGLKSFIKEGENTAEVTITLKNQGIEAYKPKEYGPSIIITRRFTKEGSSTWKIKNKSGAVISQKREELSAICDHMNIQVDNPMNVLTQDAARQFLSASNPAEKYNLFLRGTQLSQLSAEYDVCFANIQQTWKVLAQKKEAIPDLKAAFQEATFRFDQAEKAREQKQKADSLKQELAWAHVRAKEEEMAEKVSEAVELEMRLPKLEQKLAEAVRDFEAASADVATYEVQATALGDIQDLLQQKEEMKNQIKANKGKINDYVADLKRMDQSLNQTVAHIADLDRQIAAETERMRSHTQARHEEMQRKLQESKDMVDEAEKTANGLKLQLNEQNRMNEDTNQQGFAISKKLEEQKGSIASCEGMIVRAKQAQHNSLVPYGKNIKELLQTIEKTAWQGDKPLGPLGMFVKAKDPATWGRLLRSQLAYLLTAFAVTNGRDRAELKKLLDRSGNHNVQIIITEKDLFDYSGGEPPENYLTVLRALEISDPYVLRILINQSRIERQLLTQTRREAQDQLRSLGGGSAWTNDGFAVKVFPEGGAHSSPLLMRVQNEATNLLLTGRDAATEIRHLQDELKQLETIYREILSEEQNLRANFVSGKKLADALKTRMESAAAAARKVRHIHSTLQAEANEDLPSGVASLQAAKADAEEEQKNVKEQAEAVMKQKADMGERQKGLLTKSNDLKRRIDEFLELRHAAGVRVEEAVERRLAAKGAKDHFEKKYSDEDKKFQAAQAVADVLQEEFTNWTKKAQEYCDRVENPRKPQEVKRLLEGVQKRLANHEKQYGFTIEEMAVEVNKAKEKLQKAETELMQMSILNKAIKSSLIVRLQRWQEFRRHIALRCKFVFSYHLSQRGYYGKVLFNHEQQTLVLKVQTDDQVGTQSSREKDPKSLSGGEKSFSTICLLLSLWESIGCPLRCLDEFDVFMDAVNRRISMRMMIDTANASDKKQYILITPQDMGNVTIGSTVKVHRMSDPRRHPE